jgi:O-antigen ligase
VKSRLNAPALGLAVVATLSFIVGQLPWVKFVQGAKLLPQLAGLGIVILSVGVFLATANHVKEMKILVWITWGFLAVGAFYLALNIIPGAGGFSVYFFQSAGSIFWIWTIVVSFSQAVYNRRLALHWRGLIGLLCLGLVYLAAQNSDWASGWLPPMVGIVMILLAVDIRFGLIAVLAGVAFAIPNAIQIFNQLAQTGTEAYSWMTRVEAWRIVAEIIKVNPVLGLGPSNYYHYTPLYSILGFYLRFNSHNQYVDLIAQFGLLGLAFYLWLFWELFRLCWRLKSQVEEGFQRAYIYGALGGIAGLLAAGMLGDWVLPFVYNVGTGGFRTSVISWVFLGGAVAIEQMKKTELNDKANSAINSGH